MQRRIDITVPPDRTDDIIQAIRSLPGVLGLQVTRDGSLEPPGDVITATVLNRTIHSLMRVLDERGILRDSGSTVATTALTSTISTKTARAIKGETSDMTWEEMETIMARESNMPVSAVLVMAISGALAAVGLATDALHYVLAAMVIAPGFEPIVRIPFGVVAGNRAWSRGIVTTIQAYGVLIAGAAVTAVLLTAVGEPLLAGKGAYLQPGALVSYWTSFSAPALAMSLIGGAGGALLIATNREVLTAGVMIALALIPSAAIVGLATVMGDVSLGAQGLLRWVVDVALVLAGSTAIWLWKRSRIQRRKAAF